MPISNTFIQAYDALPLALRELQSPVVERVGGHDLCRLVGDSRASRHGAVFAVVFDLRDYAQNCPVSAGADVLTPDTCQSLNIRAVLFRHTVFTPLGDRVVTSNLPTPFIELSHQGGFSSRGLDSLVQRKLFGRVNFCIHAFTIS